VAHISEDITASEETVFTRQNGVEFKKINLVLLFSSKNLKFHIRGWFIFLSAATCRHVLGKIGRKLKENRRKIGGKLLIGKTQYYF
jgi:hypothetical protein